MYKIIGVSFLGGIGVIAIVGLVNFLLGKKAI